MLRLIYNLFGWHYCHSFTKWERRVVPFRSRITVITDNGRDFLRFIKVFETRSCTECERIQQKEIY